MAGIGIWQLGGDLGGAIKGFKGAMKETSKDGQAPASNNASNK